MNRANQGFSTSGPDGIQDTQYLEGAISTARVRILRPNPEERVENQDPPALNVVNESVRSTTAEQARKDISTMLRNTRMFFLQISFIISSILVTIYLNISEIVPLAVATTLNIYELLFFAVKKKKGLVKFNKRRLYYLLESSTLAIFYISVMLCILDVSFMRSLYTLIPFLCYTCLRGFIFQMKKQNQEYTAVNDLVVLVIRMFLSIQLFSIAFKLDGFLQWSWREVFWTFWVLLAVLMGFTFISFLACLRKYCLFYMKESSCYDVVGFTWCLFFIAGVTTISLVIVVQSIEAFEINSIAALKSGLIALLVFLICMLIFQVIFRTHLYTFFVSLVISGMEEEQSQLSERIDNNIIASIDQQSVKEEKQAEEYEQMNSVSIPHLLYKYTSTYFRTQKATPDEENSKAKKKQKINDKEEHGKKKKLNNQRNDSKRKKVFKSISSLHSHDNIEPTTTDHRDVNILYSTAANLNPGATTVPDHTEATLSSRTPKNAAFQKKVVKNTNTDQAGEEEYSFNNDFNNHQRLTELQIHTENQGDERGHYNPQTNESQNAHNLKYIKPTPFDRSIKSANISRAYQESEDQSEIQRSEAQEEVSADIGNSKMEESKIQEKSNNLCLVCYDNVPDSVFMPCGHAGVCYTCSLELWESTDECFLCRNKIAQILQIELVNPVDGAYQVKKATQLLRV